MMPTPAASPASESPLFRLIEKDMLGLCLRMASTLLCCSGRRCSAWSTSSARWWTGTRSRRPTRLTGRLRSPLARWPMRMRTTSTCSSRTPSPRLQVRQAAAYRGDYNVQLLADLPLLQAHASCHCPSQAQLGARLDRRPSWSRSSCLQLADRPCRRPVHGGCRCFVQNP